MLLPGSRRSSCRPAPGARRRRPAWSVPGHAARYNGYFIHGVVATKPGDVLYWSGALSQFYMGTKAVSFGAYNRKIFTCPVEQIGFGDWNDGLFSYTHYGLNGWFNGDASGIWRNINRVTQPTIVAVSLDSNLKNTYCLKYPYTTPSQLGFRHSYNVNMVCVDGHAEAQKYGPFMKMGNIYTGRLEKGYK